MKLKRKSIRRRVKKISIKRKKTKSNIEIK